VSATATTIGHPVGLRWPPNHGTAGQAQGQSRSRSPPSVTDGAAWSGLRRPLINGIVGASIPWLTLTPPPPGQSKGQSCSQLPPSVPRFATRSKTGAMNSQSSVGCPTSLMKIQVKCYPVHVCLTVSQLQSHVNAAAAEPNDLRRDCAGCVADAFARAAAFAMTCDAQWLTTAVPTGRRSWMSNAGGAGQRAPLPVAGFPPWCSLPVVWV